MFTDKLIKTAFSRPSPIIVRLVYIFEACSDSLRLLPPLTMPTPELKKAPSKGLSEGSPHASPDTTPIADPNAPQLSGLMNEAWNAANAELPQAHGVEKFLNSIGELIALVPRCLCADA